MIDTKESKFASWRSPSNIALVKYWGKKEGQIPANSSISFTLDNATTETTVSAKYAKQNLGIHIDFTFENEKNPAFEEKLIRFLNLAKQKFTWLDTHSLTIKSSNNFPHSSGIASSASAYSALALCLSTLHEDITGEKLQDFYQIASNWARIGSGSACRSVYGGYNLWGKNEFIQEGNDKYAVNIDSSIHPVFQSFKDTILIIEKGKKSVSSTKGHALLKNHPFAETRYKLANDNIGRLIEILKSGDLEGFVELVESEALMLHALMMTSPQAFILMKPETLRVIEKIQDYRNQTGIQLLFTLDAGANVHLLNPAQDDANVQEFVKNELIGYCQNESYFCNSVGKGPERI
jgi:diphosphomevalonate decarboxylase